jgi:hypothetical protein
VLGSYTAWSSGVRGRPGSHGGFATTSGAGREQVRQHDLGTSAEAEPFQVLRRARHRAGIGVRRHHPGDAAVGEHGGQHRVEERQPPRPAVAGVVVRRGCRDPPVHGVE